MLYNSWPLEKGRLRWDNKRGWSIPKNIIDKEPLMMLFCAATLGGKPYSSDSYVFHTTGKNSMFPPKVSKVSLGIYHKVLQKCHS